MLLGEITMLSSQSVLNAGSNLCLPVQGEILEKPSSIHLPVLSKPVQCGNSIYFVLFTA